ncbi:uncharacterized protein [Diabrotica undecimpunctata]|uniref:uncharacterized protein n=1 Tax=Diabrotica undecimpunctata TaxID=50387 RepID=UPI003B63B1C1
MIVYTIFTVIVFSKLSSAGRLPFPFAVGVDNLNGSRVEPLPSADQLVAQAFVEEVLGDVRQIQPLEKLDPLKTTLPLDGKDDSDEADTNQDDQKSEQTTAEADGNDHDKISQVQKQYKGKKGHKSAKFGEKKGHKKGHKTKGYNNRFHKDEYVKEHKLYGDAYRDNHKNRYVDSQNRHANKDSGYGRSDKHSHSHSANRFGKKGVDDVGKYDDYHEDFDNDSKHEQINRHKTKRIKIKHENPYPNHRPY